MITDGFILIGIVLGVVWIIRDIICEVSQEAKQMLSEKGCKVLGYNCSTLVS